jgi:hypothetical protein
MRYPSLVNYCMLAEKTCQSVKCSTFKSWDMIISKRSWENPLEVQLRFTYNLGYTRPSTKSVVKRHEEMTDHLQTFLLRLTNWLLKFWFTKCEEQIYPGHAKKSNLSFCCLKVMDRLPRSRFFSSILWCSLTGNHPQEEFQIWLQVRKVENFKNPGILCQPVGNYCLNIAISEKNIPWNLETLAHSFQKKSPLYESHYISPSSKNLPKTKTFP